MSISSENLSQKTVDVSLTIGKEKPQFISVNRNLTIQQLRVFLFDNSKITNEDSLLLIDGLVANEDTIIKTMMVNFIPSINVFYNMEMKECCLHFQEYSLYASFPIESTIELVKQGFNSYLLRTYGNMMSLSDIIVFYENEIIPIQTEIGSLRLDNCNDLYFVYPENTSISPFVQLYAQERYHCFKLEAEMEETKTDLEQMISLVDKLTNTNKTLQDQLDKMDHNEITSQYIELEKQNKELEEQVKSLTEQVIDLKRTTRESDSQLDILQKEREAYELDVFTMKNCMKEMEIEKNEDKKRLDFLHEECESLSTQLNEAMELTEKYKTGYMKYKQRLNSPERTRVIVKDSSILSPSSMLYHLVLESEEKEKIMNDLEAMKDDIMESEAYSIMIIQITGLTFPQEAIHYLYGLIHDGFFPKLRIIEMYECPITQDQAECLYTWMFHFPFIEVFSPNVIQYKTSDICYKQLSRYISNTPYLSIQTVDLRSCKLNDDGVLLLCELISHHFLPNMQSLLLDNNCFSDTGLCSLSLVLIPACLSKGLTSFSCYANSLTTEGIKSLAVIIHNNPQIQRLWLGNINMTDQGLHILCDALIKSNCFSLNLLNLVNNSITPTGMREFRSLLNYHIFNITDFSLANNPIGDEGFIDFLDALKGSQNRIHRFYLRGSFLTAQSMEVLKNTMIQKDLSCVELGLSSNPIGNEGFAFIVDGLIEGGIEIKKLWLFDTGLDNGVIPSIERLIQHHLFEKLLLLDIANNQIDDHSFSCIVSCIIDNKQPLQLEELWIGGCPIQDDGIVILVSLISSGYLPNLHILYVDMCGITDDGAVMLVSCLSEKYSHFKQLNLTENEISESVKEELKEQTKSFIEQFDI